MFKSQYKMDLRFEDTYEGRRGRQWFKRNNNIIFDKHGGKEEDKEVVEGGLLEEVKACPKQWNIVIEGEGAAREEGKTKRENFDAKGV